MMMHSMMQYVQALTLQISRDYDCKVAVKFHRGKRTYCAICGKQDTFIKYGLATLQKEHTGGMNEYESLKWVWNQCGKIKGEKALWAIVLHEFAHVLQPDRRVGKMHTPGFISALQNLIRSYPYATVKNL